MLVVEGWKKPKRLYIYIILIKKTNGFLADTEAYILTSLQVELQVVGCCFFIQVLLKQIHVRTPKQSRLQYIATSTQELYCLYWGTPDQ